MVDRADVVVIGSGGLGAATAFYLDARGDRHVVVVDKHDLASQTSPRAAGLMSHARTTDLMVELVKLAAANLECFAADTGQPLDWTRSGSLKVAAESRSHFTAHPDAVAAGLSVGLGGAVAGAGAVATNDMRGTIEAFVRNGSKVEAGGKVGVTANDNSDATAKVLSDSVAGGLTGAALSAGVATDLYANTTSANVADSGATAILFSATAF